MWWSGNGILWWLTSDTRYNAGSPPWRGIFLRTVRRVAACLHPQTQQVLPYHFLVSYFKLVSWFELHPLSEMVCLHTESVYLGSHGQVWNHVSSYRFEVPYLKSVSRRVWGPVHVWGMIHKTCTVRSTCLKDSTYFVYACCHCAKYLFNVHTSNLYFSKGS